MSGWNFYSGVVYRRFVLVGGGFLGAVFYKVLQKFGLRVGNSDLVRRGRCCPKGGIGGGWGNSKTSICYNICNG